MSGEREKAAVPVGRAFKVAPLAVAVMARHRDAIPGMVLVERELVPALDAFVSAVTALRMFDATREVTVQRRDANLQELRKRTRFWLTYVRLDLPNYAPAVVEGTSDSPDVIIDRGRGLIDLVGEYADGEAPHYLAQMTAEIQPLHARSVQDRAEAFENGLARQTLQRQVRTTLIPVSEGLVRLRLLLRNALGGTHSDVRALDIDPPSKRKQSKEAGKANATEESQSMEVNASLAGNAPTTAQRMAIGQA